MGTGKYSKMNFLDREISFIYYYYYYYYYYFSYLKADGIFVFQNLSLFFSRVIFSVVIGMGWLGRGTKGKDIFRLVISENFFR